MRGALYAGLLIGFGIACYYLSGRFILPAVIFALAGYVAIEGRDE